MAIDTNTTVKAEFCSKWIQVTNMRAILVKLLPDDVLIPNQVGNLAINRDGEYIGYINVSQEELVLD